MDKTTTQQEVMEVMAFHEAKERRLQELNKELEKENLTEEAKAEILIHIKGSEENGLSNDEQTRNEVSDDTDKRGNDSEGYGKEQSENANQTLGEQRPQEIRDVSGSSNEEGNNVKEESNLSNGDDAIRSEEVYKGGISNTEINRSVLLIPYITCGLPIWGFVGLP